MESTTNWTPFEAASTDEVLSAFPRPLDALSGGLTPAIVLRGAYPDSAGLVKRFYERGYLDRDTVGKETQLSGGPYLDLGTSLGRVGSDQEAFFAHAARTHQLFSTLFDGFADPVRTMYDSLSSLAVDKRVQTAEELDQRRYSPAIFRMYHGDEGHRAHFDSVAKRGNPASDYIVSKFELQFAGILSLQKGSETLSAEPFIYRCHGPEPEVQEILSSGRFDDYAAEHEIPKTQVDLEPGDLYFFFTENVHAVPPIERDRARIVLAIFFATSDDDERLFIWS